MPADAYGQVSLALTLSQAGAEWWTNLAVDLQWRLAATGQALREGVIDLARAKAIAEATASLDDAKARAVEGKVLPRAGDQTIGQLRASLRRAVITADPDGAERRRQQAERRAKVILYPDVEGTASLTGQNLPGIRAAAAFAQHHRPRPRAQGSRRRRRHRPAPLQGPPRPAPRHPPLHPAPTQRLRPTPTAHPTSATPPNPNAAPNPTPDAQPARPTSSHPPDPTHDARPARPTTDPTPDTSTTAPVARWADRH